MNKEELIERHENICEQIEQLNEEAFNLEQEINIMNNKK